MTFQKVRKRLLAAIVVCLGLVAVPQTVLAMKFFVDNELGEVKPEEKKVPAAPGPVQLLFEFQRDGGPNARATKQVKPWALEDIKATGAFSEVVETTVASGAVLSIKFNNIVKKEDLDQAKRDGFRAGLGFGLFGGVVATDNYEVTLDYIPATGAQPIRTVVRHKLYSKFGKKDVVIPGTEYAKADEAVKALVRQALDRGVNTIVADAAFPG